MADTRVSAFFYLATSPPLVRMRRGGLRLQRAPTSKKLKDKEANSP